MTSPSLLTGGISEPQEEISHQLAFTEEKKFLCLKKHFFRGERNRRKENPFLEALPGLSGAMILQRKQRNRNHLRFLEETTEEKRRVTSHEDARKYFKTERGRSTSSEMSSQKNFDKK